MDYMDSIYAEMKDVLHMSADAISSVMDHRMKVRNDMEPRMAHKRKEIARRRKRNKNKKTHRK